MPTFAGLNIRERILPGFCSIVGCRTPGALPYAIQGGRSVAVLLCPIHYGTCRTRCPAGILIERLTEEEVLVLDVMER